MRIINDVKKYWGYMLYSTVSRLKAEVANSYLGWLWWLLEPLGFMLIYAVVFGYIFGSSEPYFSVFIFIGNTMWGFFSKSIMACVGLIRANEAIISKVYLPKYILVIIEMLVNGFKMLVSFGLVAIMMIIFRIPVSGYIVLAIPVLAVFFLITFALGTLLMHCGVYVSDLSPALSIVLNMMMFFTGIFFSIESRVAAPLSVILECCNPVAFLLTSARKTIIYSAAPDIVVLVIWLITSTVLSWIAIRIIYKNENNYVKII